MLQLHREYHHAPFGVRMGEHGLLHSQFRIQIKDRDGFAKDDALLNPMVRPSLDGHTLLIQLIGASQFYAAGKTLDLHPGDFVLCPYDALEGYAHQGRQRVLIIEWRSGSLGTTPLRPLVGPLRLSQTAVDRLQGWAGRIASRRCPDDELAACAAGILGILRGEGLPFDPWSPSDLMESVPLPIRRLSAALDTTISALSDRPGMFELESLLGWSRQHISHVTSTFQKRYWLSSGGSWRNQSQAWRILVGSSLMSRPEARTEKVARLLGYGSPSALCRAFANAGLPSPGSLRDVLRQRGYSVR